MHINWEMCKELSRVLYGKKWSMKLKGKVFKIFMSMARVYSSENWQKRMYFGAQRESYGEWCEVIYRSIELMSLTWLYEVIVVVVRMTRLMWYRHILRKMEDITTTTTNV